MVKISIQFFGGRGSSSGRGNNLKGGGIVNPLEPDIDGYKVPFPSIKDQEFQKEALQFERREGKYAGLGSTKSMDLPVEEVQLDKLTNSQDFVLEDKMDSLLKLSVSQLQQIKDNNPKHWDIPYVIKWKNHYQIRDGHHRLSALWAKGAKKAKVRVLDLEKIK